MRRLGYPARNPVRVRIYNRTVKSVGLVAVHAHVHVLVVDTLKVVYCARELVHIVGTVTSLHDHIETSTVFTITWYLLC